MRANFAITKPNDVEATVTATAPIAEWREIRAQLLDKWPGSDFARAISEVIRQAEAKFYAESPPQPER
jgi:hypothetical protein